MGFYFGDFDGSGEVSILIHSGRTLLLIKRESAQWITKAICSGDIGGSATWNIAPADKIYVADLNGDGKDEILIVNDDNMGVLGLSGDGFEVKHISAGWVMSADQSFGWNLGSVDRHYIGDVDGDGRDEVIMRSAEWIGVLSYNGSKLIADHLSFDWVLNSDRSFGWNLGPWDQHFIGDIDGDGRDEVIIRSTKWIRVFGVLSFNGNKFVADHLSYDWVMSADGSFGWNLGVNDTHFIGDVNGDGKDEVVMRSPEWMGVVSFTGGKFVLDHLSHDWIHKADGTGGWNLGRVDKVFIGDMNGDGKDEVILRSPEWLGFIAFEGGKFVAKHLSYDWVLSLSGTFGWNLSFTDIHFIKRNTIGRDEIIIYNHNSNYVGSIRWNDSKFYLEWIKDHWICPIPPYVPNKWNDDPDIQWHNNCYNYACDIILFNNKSQPGRASGHPITALTCPNVIAAATSDELRPRGKNDPLPACYHKVALVVAPGWDYHWYRQDNNTLWSHKPGRTRAKNVDESGNLITDPKTADRGPYTEFCGFFWVCHREVDIN